MPIQVQANHLRGLGLEVGIVGDEVPFQPMRLQSVLAPDALHGRERHVAQFRREFAAAPVRGAIFRLVLERLVEHPRLQFGHRPYGRAARVQRHQPGKILKFKRLGPSRDEGVVAGQLGANAYPTFTVGPQQHATRAPRQRRTALSNRCFEFAALVAPPTLSCACLSRWSIHSRYQRFSGVDERLEMGSPRFQCNK